MLFTALGFVWVGLLRKNKESAHKIHYLMAAQVAAKTLTVLSQAGMFHAIAVYGNAEGWFVPYVSERRRVWAGLRKWSLLCRVAVRPGRGPAFIA